MPEIKADSRLCLESQVCFPLYSAANAVVRSYRPLLDKLDLTYAQYLVMMVLWAGDQISVKALGEKLHLDSGTLTPLLKRLALKGLLTRDRSESDERVRVLSLTQAGKDLKQQAREVPLAMFDRLGMSEVELRSLKASCDKLLSHLCPQRLE